MKQLFIVLLFPFVIWEYAHSQCFDDQLTVISDPVPCDDRAWVMYFEDNFDDPVLEPSKWIYPYQCVLAGFDFAQNGTKQWYANTGAPPYTGSVPQLPISNNITTENGHLKIIARRESTPIQGTYVTGWENNNPSSTATSTFHYSSGWIESKRDMGFGYYEAMCWIPSGKGLWPAFWLFDQDSEGYRYEIDIFEFWNEFNCQGIYKPDRNQKNPHWTIHGGKVAPDSQCGDDLHGCFGLWEDEAMDFSLQPHKFALEWDYYKIVWYVDGAALHWIYRFNTRTMPSQNIDCNSIEDGDILMINESWPFTDEMQVRFNLGIQYGNGNEPEPSDEFPKVMDIDYFRYYKKGPCLQNLTLSGNLNLSSTKWNTIMGNNVTILDDAVIPNGYQLEVVAANTLNLGSFTAPIGTEFSAHIDPGYCDISQLQIPIFESDNTTLKQEDNGSPGVADVSTSTGIKAYPNPASDLFNIEVPSEWNGINSIEIRDIEGSLMLKKNYETNGLIELDIKNLAIGSYLVKVSNKTTGQMFLTRFTKAN